MELSLSQRSDMSNSTINTKMASLAGFIVKQSRYIVLVFIMLFVFSIFSSGWVIIDEDTTKFLPEGTQGRDTLEIDAVEFDSFGSADLLVEHMTEADAQTLADRMAALDNIAYSNVDIHPDINGSGTTVIVHASFMSLSTDDESRATLDEILDTAEDYDNSYVYSPLLDNMAEIINEQVTAVIILAVIAVVVVLFLTSQSYAEIPVLLLVFGVAAAINMGTNFLFGTISLISNAVAVVLQLALSLDYAIILCNRYREAHEKYEIRKAVVVALTGAVPEILASSLTTIAGLFAMTFMKLTIGADIGFVLIKAIIISLLTVFLFMPALLMLFGRLIDKTSHKKLLPDIRRLGNFSYRSRFVMPAVFAVVLVLAIIGSGKLYITTDVTYAPAKKMSDNDAAYYRLLEENGTNAVEILVPGSDYKKEAALAAALDAYPEVYDVTCIANIEVSDGVVLTDNVGVREICELAEVDEVSAKALLALYAAKVGDQSEVIESVDGYKAPLLELFNCLYENMNNEALELSSEQLQMINDLYARLDRFSRELKGEHYTRIALNLDMPMESEETFAMIDELHALADSYYSEDTYINGYSVIYKEFKESYSTDKTTTSAMSIALVMLILLFTFKSISMPVLLILVIQGSIWINFTIPMLTGNPVYFIVYLIDSAIMMGSNIDYAIVISSRYRELRRFTEDKREAMRETLNFAFPTVMTSGGIMIVSGILVYLKVSESIVAGFGHYIATGTLVTVFLVMFVLPQILILFDGLIEKTTLKAKKPNAGTAKRYISIAACIALTITGILGIVSYGDSRDKAGAVADERINACYEKSDEAEKLLDSAAEYDELASKLGDYAAGFAEHLLTEQIGSVEIADGEVQLAEGMELLEEGQATFDVYSEMYQHGLAEYNAGLEEYNTSMREYEAAKAQFDSITPIYYACIVPYNAYLDAQERYQEALENDDQSRAAILETIVSTQYALFESEILSTGYSISGLIEEYESAREQLAEAEALLADGKAQLDDGKAQLADAQKQLADGKAELDSGYDEYAYSEAQYWEARKYLSDNREQLGVDIETLDRLFELEKELEPKINSIDADGEIRAALSSDASVSDICNAVIAEQHTLVRQAEKQLRLTRTALIAMLISAILCILGAAMEFKPKTAELGIIFTAFAFISAGVALLLWYRGGCIQAGYLKLIAIAALTLSVLTLIFGRKPTDQAAITGMESEDE